MIPECVIKDYERVLGPLSRVSVFMQRPGSRICEEKVLKFQHSEKRRATQIKHLPE